MYAQWRSYVSTRRRQYHQERPGLLIATEDALDYWNSGLLKSKTKTPKEACGVSLQFLANLAKSLEELKLEGKARSTKMVVARFLSPAGLLQAPQAVPTRNSTPQPMQHANLDFSSLDSKCGSSSTYSPRSSMDAKAFHPGAQRALNKGTSVSVHQGLTATKEIRTRLWDFIDPHWCGQPSYYVSHFWGDDFMEMLVTLVDRVSRQPQDHQSNAQEENEPVDLNTIFVWLDVLALPQQFLGNSTTLDGPIFGPPPSYIDPIIIKEVVCACEKGVVIALDQNMAILNRVWPLYEVWIAAYYCPQDMTSSRVYAAIPRDVHVSALLHLQTSCMNVLDLGRAAASRAEDKQHIMTEVRHAAGQKRMQTLASESILRAARGWLRWSGDPQDMALYAALMMQSKEHTQLQYVLNAVDEIHDDEATLKEIRDLFKIYDEDGTGGLEEDEFAQVLGLAGFGPEESRNMFALVDTDGGGSVELDEFEAWWIESQRQSNRSCRPKPDLTVNGLATNLKGLAAMLERRSNKHASDNVYKLIEELEALAASPRSPFPNGQLPPSEVYGDWRSVANTLGFKVTFDDLKPALRMMHGLLMSNVDTLALDSSPAALLPSPNSLGNNYKLHKVVLAWFLALMAELLSRNPRTLREAGFFLREAIDISAPEKHETTVHSTSSVMDAAIKKARREQVKVGSKGGRNDAEMEAIVTNMVRLKHGKDTIVSNKLIAEANVSLSAWMAASKGKLFSQPKVDKKGQKASHNGNSAQVQSVIDFTNSYLNSGGTASGLQVEASASSTTNCSPGGVAGGSRGQAPPAKKGPYDGKSHAEIAYSLGQSCLAAMDRYKRGLSIFEDDEALEEAKEGSEDNDTEEGNLAGDDPTGSGLLSDRFQQQQQQQQQQQLQTAGPAAAKKSATASSPDRQAPEQEGALDECKTPGKITPQPHHPLPPLADATHPSPKASLSRRTAPPNDAVPQPSANVEQPTQTGGLSPERSFQGLQADQQVPQGYTEVPKLDSIPHLSMASAPGNPIPHPQLAPLPASYIPPMPPSLEPSGSEQPRMGVLRAKATVPQSSAQVPEGSSGSESYKRNGLLDSMPWLSNKSADVTAAPPEKTPLLDPVKNGFKHSTTSSLSTPGHNVTSYEPGHVHMPYSTLKEDSSNGISCPHSGAPSVPCPDQKSPTEAHDGERNGTVLVGGLPPKHHPPSGASSLVGNSFGQRVAIAKEQQRVTTPMVQPLVSTSDLKALLQRMSTRQGAKAAENGRGTLKDHAGTQSMPAGLFTGSVHEPSSHSFSQSLFRRDRDSSHERPSNSTTSVSVVGENSGGLNDNRGLGRQSLEPLTGKRSRLQKSSTTVNEGTSPQVAPSNTTFAGASSSKWSSQLAGIGLPGLTLPKPAPEANERHSLLSKLSS